MRGRENDLPLCMKEIYGVLRIRYMSTLKNDEWQKKTDEELVNLTLQSQDYFLYLMKRYRVKILPYIKRISNVSYEEAEDILQDVFVNV